LCGFVGDIFVFQFFEISINELISKYRRLRSTTNISHAITLYIFIKVLSLKIFIFFIDKDTLSVPLIAGRLGRRSRIKMALTKFKEPSPEVQRLPNTTTSCKPSFALSA
jgi:hypothetical protein